MRRHRPAAGAGALLCVAVLALSACDRGAPDSARPPGNTVLTTPPSAATSTPLPVSPSGLTNPSTAGAGNDLSNSTGASGGSNTYQPPSTDNPAPNGGAGSAASAASQSESSQTRGTSPPPNDGTLPRGTEGSTGSRRGGGKS